MENKIFAVKKLINYRQNEYRWWSVIDCGQTKEGRMTVGNFWNNHFKKDGKTYRYYSEIFNPPHNLTEWQEIKIVDKTVTMVVDDHGNSFSGWEDKENSGLEILQKFAKILGKDLTLLEVKNLIENHKDL